MNVDIGTYVNKGLTFTNSDDIHGYLFSTMITLYIKLDEHKNSIVEGLKDQFYILLYYYEFDQKVTFPPYDRGICTYIFISFLLLFLLLFFFFLKIVVTLQRKGKVDEFSNLNWYLNNLTSLMSKSPEVGFILKSCQNGKNNSSFFFLDGICLKESSRPLFFQTFMRLIQMIFLWNHSLNSESNMGLCTVVVTPLFIISIV
jgi:hypothetical protein